MCPFREQSWWNEGFCWLLLFTFSHLPPSSVHTSNGNICWVSYRPQRAWLCVSVDLSRHVKRPSVTATLRPFTQECQPSPGFVDTWPQNVSPLNILPALTPVWYTELTMSVWIPETHLCGSQRLGLKYSRWLNKCTLCLSLHNVQYGNTPQYIAHTHTIKDFYLLHICQYWKYWFSDHIWFAQVAGLPEDFWQAVIADRSLGFGLGGGILAKDEKKNPKRNSLKV